MQQENQEQMKRRLSEMKRELAKKEKKLELKSRLQSMKDQLAKTQKKLKKAERAARVKAHVQKKLKDLAGKSTPENFQEFHELDSNQVSVVASRVISPDCDSAPDLLVDAIPPSQLAAQLSDEQTTLRCTETPCLGDERVISTDSQEGKRGLNAINSGNSTRIGLDLCISDSGRNFSSMDVNEKLSMKKTADESAEMCQFKMNNDGQYHIPGVNAPECPKTKKAPEAMCSQNIDSQNVTVSKEERTLQSSAIDKSSSSNLFPSQSNCVQLEGVKNLDCNSGHLKNNRIEYTESVRPDSNTCGRPVSCVSGVIAGIEPDMYVPIKRRVSRTRKRLSSRKNKTEAPNACVECNTMKSFTPDSMEDVDSCNSIKSSQNITKVRGVQILNIKTPVAENIETERSNGYDSGVPSCRHPVVCAEKIENECTLDIPPEVDDTIIKHTERIGTWEEQFPDCLEKPIGSQTRIPLDSQLDLKKNIRLEGNCASSEISDIIVGENGQKDLEVSHHSPSSLLDSDIVISSQTSSQPRKRRRTKSRNWSAIVTPRKSSRIASLGNSQTSSSLNGSFLQSFSQDSLSHNSSNASMILPKWFDGVSQSFLSSSLRKKSRKLFPSLPRLVLEQHRFTVNFVEFSLPVEQFAEICSFQRNQDKNLGCVKACQSNQEHEGLADSNGAGNSVHQGCTVDDLATLSSENAREELLTDEINEISGSSVEFFVNVIGNQTTIPNSSQIVRITTENVDNAGCCSVGKHIHEKREMNSTQDLLSEDTFKTDPSFPSHEEGPCMGNTETEPHAAIHTNIGVEAKSACISVGTNELPQLQEKMADMRAKLVNSSEDSSTCMVNAMKVADEAPLLEGTNYTQEGAGSHLSPTLSLSPRGILSNTGFNSSYICADVIEGIPNLSHNVTHVESLQAQRCFKIVRDERILCMFSGEFLEDGTTTDYIVVGSEYSVTVWIQKFCKWESPQSWTYMYQSRSEECIGSPLPTDNLISFVTVRTDGSRMSVDVYSCGGDTSLSTSTSIYSSPVENYKRFHYCILSCAEVAMSEFCPEKNRSYLWKCYPKKDCSTMTRVEKLEPVCGEVMTISNIPGLDNALVSCSTDGCLCIWNHVTGILVKRIDLHFSELVHVAGILEEQGLLFVCLMYHNNPSGSGSMVMVNPETGRTKTLFDYVTPISVPAMTGLKDSSIHGDNLIVLDTAGRLFIWDLFSGEPEGWAELPGSVCISAPPSSSRLYSAQLPGCVHFINLQ